MSERPTPETDAEVTTFTSISKLKRRFEASTGKVSADFARKLERERDEAREQRDILRSNKMSDPLLETTFKHLIRERDEARAAAKLAYSILAKVNRPSLEAAAARSSIKHINNTPMEWLYSIIQNWKATQ